MSDPSRTASEVTLSDAWRDWLVDNLLAGAPADALVQQLIEWGAPSAVASAEVGRFSQPSILDFLRRERSKATWQSHVVDLQQSLLDTAPVAVIEADWPSKDVFFREYYARNRPAVFRGIVNTWGVSGWTMSALRERFGDVQVDVCVNRTTSATPDRDYKNHQVRMSLMDYIERVQTAGHTNDLYLIANNHALRDTGLRGLLDDVIVDDTIFDPNHLPGACSLWIGPSGTITPLHHDVSNILFGQIEGRKRFTLIPPQYVSQFDWNDYYAAPAHPPFPDVHSVEIELGPGDALFLPVGWLHHVEALEPSVCFSLLCFRAPNSFSEFKPGAVLSAG